MLAASEPIAGADTALNIVLGIGVLLLFAGILIRALARQHRGLARTSPLHTLLKAITRQSDSSNPWARPSSASPDRSQPSTSPAPSARPRVLEAAAVPRTEALGEQERVDAANPKSSAARPDVREPEPTRLSRASLERLGRTLDESRRLHAAENRIAEELDTLPETSWLVERDVLIGARRIPFLVLGATGVFAIGPTDGAWNVRDLRVLSEVGDHVRRQLPGYDGPVHAAVCLAFDEMKPRSWYGGQDERGRGGWVLGLDWLHSWMLSFGLDQGLRESDIRRLDEAAGPFWDRRSTARLPATRNIG
jgi:hypothetical protein